MTKKNSIRFFRDKGLNPLEWEKIYMRILTLLKKFFDTADKVLGKSVTSLCFDGPEEDLKQTVNTQPSIVTMSIAALEAFKSELNITPTYTAGHSLGEYCAMYASGVMDLETTMLAIQKRADLMGQVKGGAMAAILNAPAGSLDEVLEKLQALVTLMLPIIILLLRWLSLEMKPLLLKPANY